MEVPVQQFEEREPHDEEQEVEETAAELSWPSHKPALSIGG